MRFWPLASVLLKRVEDGRLKMPVKPFLDDPCPDFLEIDQPIRCVISITYLALPKLTT